MMAMPTKTPVREADRAELEAAAIEREHIIAADQGYHQVGGDCSCRRYSCRRNVAEDGAGDRLLPRRPRRSAQN
jgi:hypothetical protein